VKSYFARPRELTGAMDEPVVATADAGGAGFDGGFCAGLCPNAGESGPTRSKAVMTMATKDLARRETSRLSTA